VKLFSKNSNLFDRNPPTSQADRRTDRQTTCDRNTALCTKVHCAIKMVIKLLQQQSTFRRYTAIMLSPFFLFLLFSMCHYAVIWCDKLRFLHLYINIDGFTLCLCRLLLCNALVMTQQWNNNTTDRDFDEVMCKIR